MTRKIVTGLALMAALIMLAPQAALARSHGGGGMHFGGGFRGGAVGMRGFAPAMRGYAGGKFVGAPVARWSGGGWKGGGWNTGYRWRGRGWRGYPYWGAAAVIGAATAGAYYGGYPYYYDDGCYQFVTVYGPYGPQTQRVWVCE